MSPAGKLLLFSCLSDNLYIHCECKAMTMITKFYRTTLGFRGSSAVKESTCRAGDFRLISGSGRSAGEGIGYPLQYSWASLVAQLVNNLQCGKPGIDPCVGKIPWRSECLPTLLFWPGEFHGLYNPWSHKESDTTEWLSLCFTSQDNSRVYLREELAEGIKKC